MKLIDIVIPVYCERDSLSRLVEALDKVTSSLLQYKWQYLFVNDGSKDRSLEELHRLAETNKRVLVIDLARNYGKEIALSAGVLESRADAVICIDADLQHPPSLIPEIIRAWETGADVVATARKSIERQPFLRVMGSNLFYFLMRHLSDLNLRSGATDYRLITRQVIEEFRKVREKRRMFRALIDWLGFKQVWVEFSAAEREHGESSFSYRQLWNLAFDSFISYSSFPLRLIGYLGTVISLGSGLLLTWMLAFHLFDPSRFGYRPVAMIVVFNTLLIGLVLCAMGLMSLYINKIYTEVIERPLYSIREKVNF